MKAIIAIVAAWGCLGLVMAMIVLTSDGPVLS